MTFNIINDSNLKEKIFFDIWKLIDENYVFFQDKNINWIHIRDIFLAKVKNVEFYEELYNIISNMLSLLKDPHTKFLFFNNCNYELLPLSIVYSNNEYYIENINSEKSPLKSGMKILSMNNISIKALEKDILQKYTLLSSKEIINKILLKIFNTSRYCDIIATDNQVIVQDTISQQTLDLNLISKKILDTGLMSCSSESIGNTIGYIKIPSFTIKNISDSFLEMVQQFQNKPYLIIDVRNNSGGLIDEACKCASIILNKDLVIAYKLQRKKHGSYNEFGDKIEIKLTSNKKYNFSFKKIILLCNELTQSCTEFIFLNSLKNFYTNAKIVGMKTAGLISGATIFPLFDNNRIQVTTSKLLDAQGNPMKQYGITPDYTIENSSVISNNRNDYQLAKGISLCKHI